MSTMGLFAVILKPDSPEIEKSYALKYILSFSTFISILFQMGIEGSQVKELNR